MIKFSTPLTNLRFQSTANIKKNTKDIHASIQVRGLGKNLD